MSATSEERRQDRLTYRDTIDSQQELSTLLGWKIRKNCGLSDDESKNFPKLLGDALLSQGNKHKVYYNYHNTKVPLGKTHTFALRMKSIQGPKQKIKYDAMEITVKISELWQVLLDSFMQIFPSAIEESIHISREIPHREREEGFEFSAESDLNASRDRT